MTDLRELPPIMTVLRQRAGRCAIGINTPKKPRRKTPSPRRSVHDETIRCINSWRDFRTGACGLRGARLDAGGSASPNYQAPATAVAPPANLRAVCYDEAGLSAYRVRMVQQQLNIGTLACKNSDGSRKLDKQYIDFVHKFTKTNAVELKKGGDPQKVNFDVLLTEIADKTAQRPAKDAEFCSRQQRALEWALTPQVLSS